jgi:hypothetical protein
MTRGSPSSRRSCRSDIYTHQNGIVDDKFRHYFLATKVNDDYTMTLDEFLKSFEYLAEAVEAVDEAASQGLQPRTLLLTSRGLDLPGPPDNQNAKHHGNPRSNI